MDVSGADFGLILCGAILLGSFYEFVALLSPRVPTISRVVQGWRDRGGWWPVLGITIALVVGLGMFAAWLWRHFLHDRRSTL